MKTAILFAILLIWSGGVVFGQSPIQTDCSGASLKTEGHFSYLLQNDSISVQQAAAALEGGKFILSRHDLIKMGNSHKFVWLHISLENHCDSSSSFILRLKNTGISDVAFFEMKDNIFKNSVNWERGIYSEMTPDLSRNIAPVFLLPARANGKSEFFLLIKKNFTHASFSVTVFSKNDFFDSTIFEVGFEGVVAGFFLFALIFNIFLLFSLRDSVYFYYSGFITSSVLLYCAYAGYGQSYLWPDFPNFDSYAASIFSMTWAFSFIQFTQIFTGQTARDGWLFHVNVFFKALALANLFLLFYHACSGRNILEAYLGPLKVILTGTQILAVFPAYLTGLKRAIGGDRPSQFFLVANTVFGISLGIDALNRWNILEVPHMMVYTLGPVGLVVEMSILSFGLTLRYHQFKHNHDKLQVALIQKEKELSYKMITTQDAERERIAQDLHDDLGGTIATVNTRLSSLLKEGPSETVGEEIKAISEIVGQAGDQIRQIAHNLMPPEFEKSGLVESVKERVVSIVSARYTFNVFGKERRMLPERELNIYRILMEVFNNIQKHAGATVVSVQFLFHPDILTVVIEDNGQQDDSKNNPENRSGIGLKNINSRLLYLSGRMQSDETPLGTTLIIDIPYDSPNSSAAL